MGRRLETRKQWRLVKQMEIRAMIREAAENMKAAGFSLCERIPPEHVEARRIWWRYPDTRSLTGRLLGDPIIQRSAWWTHPGRMEAAE